MNNNEELKDQIKTLIDKRSGSMEVITPIFVARMLNVPIDQVESAMKEFELI